MRNMVFIAFILILSACTTIKVPKATGGSKSDGIVELSYEYGMFESPQVDWNEALSTAVRRCAAWGYSTAESFGGTISRCQSYNSYGNCVRNFVTMKFQCID